MIIIAYLFHILGHYIPSWITKVSLKELRTQFKWKQLLFEMSGVAMNFLLAFIIILVITFSTTEKYLLNENAIYGTEASSIAKEIGFKDGDKIISVNDQKIIRFSHITREIILGYGEDSVKVMRGENDLTINVTENDKLKFIESNTLNHFTPRLQPETSSNKTKKKLVYNESQKGLKDALKIYSRSLNNILNLFNPSREYYKGVNSFISIKKTNGIKGVFFLLAISSLFFGVINLLPIPGFDLGNTLIALIEKLKKKKFNSKKIRIIRITCPTLLVLIMITLLSLN
ncbi:MAG: site-2 protease family protein [Flavobacteriaceae bacterium]|nr:site-2 protease family protein [Flavobacteriaceae bacterium]